MTNQKTVPSFDALTGLFLFKNSNSLFLKGLLLGLITMIVIGFSKQVYLIDSSFVVFGLLALAFTSYSLLNKKWSQAIVGFFAFLSVASDFLLYDYVASIKWLMIIPVISYIYTLWQQGDYKKELAILTLFAIYELTEFLQLDMFW